VLRGAGVQDLSRYGVGRTLEYDLFIDPVSD